MLSVNGPDAAGQLRYFPKKKVLELVLHPDRKDLFSEVAEQRFQALAKTLGVSTSLRVGRVQSSRGSVTGDSESSDSDSGVSVG